MPISDKDFDSYDKQAEKRDRVMYEINKVLKKRGIGDIDDEAMMMLIDWVGRPEFHQMMEQGNHSIEWLVDEAMNASKEINNTNQSQGQDMSQFAEGGFINDSSGQATQDMRNMIGMQ